MGGLVPSATLSSKICLFTSFTLDVYFPVLEELYGLALYILIEV